MNGNEISWTYPSWCMFVALFGMKLNYEMRSGHVTCEPFRTENLCHWPAVLRSICYVGERLACRELPNNSYLFPYCMVSIIPVLPLQCRNRVYRLVCVMHTVKLGYWFSCILCVLYLLLLLTVRLSYIWIVTGFTFEFLYTAGIRAGLISQYTNTRNN